MKRDHDPETKTAAITYFELTDEEVARAIVDFAKKIGEPIPDGDMYVRVRDSRSNSPRKPLATLVITHKMNG